MLRHIYENLVPLRVKRIYRGLRAYVEDLPHERRLSRITRSNAHKSRGLVIATFPSRPSHRNAIRKIAAEMGSAVVRRCPASTDISIYWPRDEGVFADADSSMINGLCCNIDKDFITKTFEDVSGLQLSVDPAHYAGKYVRKSKRNALHDGMVLDRPTAPDPRYVYQKLILNEDNGVAEDIRLIYMRGCLDFVYVKRRPLDSRFSNVNTIVTLEPIDSWVSADEVKMIEEICRRIGLDYGEIDSLRDRKDGKLYVVDVARTPSGPPNHLPEKDAQHAVQCVAAAFSERFQ